MTQFASAPYLLFLAVACMVYFALPGQRSRSVWLLALGLAFLWTLSPQWMILLGATVLVTYGTALGMAAARRLSDRRFARALERTLFATALVLIVGSLVAFKYMGFLAAMGNRLAGILGSSALAPIVQIALPIGISFWTFQAIAYLVDVKQGKTQPVTSLTHYALAVAFFPIVTAGPITRIQNLVPQLQEYHPFDARGMQSGLLLIGWGFFKKLMVADYLAVFVESVFANPRLHSGRVDGLLFWVAATFFALQLYCDFSGYTDIVRGSARLFGIELPINFSAPYFARSVRDFWRRWHITLMDWLRDYVYIPLGGSRKGAVRRYVNLTTVFLVSGLWHGAGIHFIVWGALNAFYQIAGELLAPARDRMVELLRIDRSTFAHRALQTVTTFTLVTIGWVFFRAASTSDAVYMVIRMFVPTFWIFVDGTLFQQGLTPIELGVALVSLGVVLITDWLSLKASPIEWLNRQHVTFRWAVYLTLIATIVVFGRYGGSYSAADFVYYRF